VDAKEAEFRLMLHYTPVLTRRDSVKPQMKLQYKEFQFNQNSYTELSKYTL